MNLNGLNDEASSIFLNALLWSLISLIYLFFFKRTSVSYFCPDQFAYPVAVLVTVQ